MVSTASKKPDKPLKKDDPQFYPRLCEAIRYSRRRLEYYRRQRMQMVRHYAGAHYSEDGDPQEVPVNLLSLYVQIVGRALIAKNPRVMFSTFSRENKPAVEAMMAWANKEIERTKMANTFRRWVADSLFSIGIMKVGLADPAMAATKTWSIAAGQPFADVVDLDDFVVDIHARDFSQAQFIGHRIRVPLDVVKGSKIYDKSRKNLQASHDRLYNEQGDQRVNVIGRGTGSGNDREFEDMVDLWEIYLPRYRMVVTIAADDVDGAAAEPSDDGESVEVLREQKWLGPDCGPYHILGLGIVPGNLMPKSPMMDLVGLHLGANNIYRKIIRTSERIKEITLFQKGMDADGANIMNASDGTAVGVDNPQSAQQIVYGGAALQTLILVASLFKDLFSFLAGNLELLGGRGAQSKTATQDKMLNENAGAGVADFQAQVTDSVSEVLGAMAWYWWKDPVNVQRSKYQVEGVSSVEVQRNVYPANHPDPSQLRRVGAYEDLDISVDPYSLAHSTPESRMQGIIQILQTLYIPLAAQAQQAGITLDFNELFQMAAKFMDQPDLNRILTIQDPPASGGSAGGGTDPNATQPSAPAQTTRTNVRVSMPGRTEKGNNMDLMNRMMGQNMGGNPRTTNGKAMGAGAMGI